MEEQNNSLDVGEIQSLISSFSGFIENAHRNLNQIDFDKYVRSASDSIIDLNQILYKLNNGDDISNDDLESLTSIKSFWHELNSQNSGCRIF